MPLESIKTRCISCTKKKHVYHSCVPIILLPKIIFYISAFWVCILHTKEWIILVYQSFFYLKFLFLYFSILSLHPSYKYYASNFRGGECMKTSLPLWLPLGRFFFFFFIHPIQIRKQALHFKNYTKRGPMVHREDQSLYNGRAGSVFFGWM